MSAPFLFSYYDIFEQENIFHVRVEQRAAGAEKATNCYLFTLYPAALKIAFCWNNALTLCDLKQEVCL